MVGQPKQWKEQRVQSSGFCTEIGEPKIGHRWLAFA